MVMQEFFTPAQLAKLAGVSPGTLANWRSSGMGPRYVKIGYHVVLYRKSQALSWLKRQGIDRRRAV